ncbi:MAG: hypothetical protein ABMA64_38505 [Myxococcota bacterium]
MRAAAIVGFATSFTSFLCSGTAPKDLEQAQEWAGVQLPPTAREVRYDGDCFQDCRIRLRFELPDRAAAEAFAASVGCPLEPTTKPNGRARPEFGFVHRQQEDPEWWDRPAAGRDILACQVEEPGVNARTVYVDARSEPPTVFYAVLTL